MFECKLKYNSWHRWVADFGHQRVGSSTDICSYTRAFLAGLFWLFICGIGVGVFCAFFGLVFYNIWDMIVNGASIAPPTIVLFGVVGALFGAAGILAGKEALAERQERQRRAEIAAGIVHEPGFLSLAYRKFKDRTCFKINFQ